MRIPASAVRWCARRPTDSPVAWADPGSFRRPASCNSMCSGRKKPCATSNDALPRMWNGSETPSYSRRRSVGGTTGNRRSFRPSSAAGCGQRFAGTFTSAAAPYREGGIHVWPCRNPGHVPGAPGALWPALPSLRLGQPRWIRRSGASLARRMIWSCLRYSTWTTKGRDHEWSGETDLVEWRTPA